MNCHLLSVDIIPRREGGEEKPARAEEGGEDVKFTAPKTREECNEYLKARIGVTWEENETQAKTLSDIKMLLVEDRLWQKDEDHFLRRTIYTMQANRRLDWKVLLLVCSAGGFVGVCVFTILMQLLGVVSVGVPIEKFMGF